VENFSYLGFHWIFGRFRLYPIFSPQGPAAVMVFVVAGVVLAVWCISAGPQGEGGREGAAYAVVMRGWRPCCRIIRAVRRVPVRISRVAVVCQVAVPSQ
jgi:hypothetical protein